MKTCTLCREPKDEAEFYIDRGVLRGRCKSCHRWLQLKDTTPEIAWKRQEATNTQWLADYVAKPKGPEWFSVVGYEGLYEVTRDGRVRSLWFKNGHADMPRAEPHEIACSPTSGGYPGWTAVDRDGTQRTTHVHEAVLTAFKGPRPDDRHLGGHRNGNPADNRVENLDWITHVENEADKRRHGRMLTGSRNHQAKLTEEQVVEMRRAREKTKDSFREIGKAFGVAGWTAHRICKGKAWKHVAFTDSALATAPFKEAA